MNWNSISLDIELDSCEGRTVAQGAMFHVDEDGERIINSLWHGIPQDANADRVLDARRSFRRTYSDFTRRNSH